MTFVATGHRTKLYATARSHTRVGWAGRKNQTKSVAEKTETTLSEKKPFPLNTTNDY